MLYTDVGDPGSSFEKIAQGAFNWALNCLNTDTQNVSIYQLNQFLKALDQGQGPGFDDLLAFWEAHFNIYVASPLDIPKEMQATLIPVFPGLVLDHSDGQPIDFSTFNKVNESYQQKVQRYFAKLSNDFQNSSNPSDSAEVQLYEDETTMSMASFVFRDYYNLLAKALLQEAIDLIKHYQISVEETNDGSLSSIAATYNQMSAPGASGPVNNQVTPSMLVTQNRELKIASEKNLWIGGYQVPKGATQTLQDSSDRFGTSTVPLAQVNQNTKGIFDAGTIFNYTLGASGPTITYEVQKNDNLIVIAEGLSMTSHQVTVPEVVSQNTHAPLSPGTVLTIPINTYSVQVEDTLASIADQYTKGPTGFGQAQFYGARGAQGHVEVLIETNNYLAGLITPGTTFPLGSTGIYTVKPNDTLRSIQQQLGWSLEQLTSAVSQKKILQPNQLLYLPATNLSSGMTGSGTFEALSNYYDLSLVRLALSNDQVPGVFSSGQTMSIPNLNNLPFSKLIDGLLNNNSFQRQAGLGSRVFLSGLNLPVYENINLQTGSPGDDQEVAGLYQLTGQQFQVNGPTGGYQISLSQSPTGGIRHINWGIKGVTGATSSHDLTFAIGATQAAKASEIAGKSIKVPGTVTASPLFTETPLRFILPQKELWTYPGTFPFQDSTTGQRQVPLKLYPFPQDLTSFLKKTPSTVLDLWSLTPRHASTPPVPQPIQLYNWATRIRVTIKKLDIPGSTSGTPLDQSYELLGPTEQDMSFLRELISSDQTNTVNQIYFLYASQRNGQHSVGYESGDATQVQYQFNQSDLSSYSRPGEMLISSLYLERVEQSSHPPDYRPMLEIIWKSGITRSGGYYLYYHDQATGTGFPATIFNEDALGEISLLITYQTLPFPVPAFANAWIVGDPLPAPRTRVFAEAPQIPHRISNVPVGSIRFEASRPNPGATGATDTLAHYLQEDYSLLGYRVAATGGYTGSNLGLPLTPQNPPGSSGPASLWHYEQTVPIYRFYNESPGSTGSSSPYAGMGQTATIQWSWTDLFGNRLTPQPLQLQVGYTDEIIGLSQWPELEYNYEVDEGKLALSMRFNPDKLQDVPGLTSAIAAKSPTGASGATSGRQDNIQQIRAQYQRILYQLQDLQKNDGAVYLSQTISNEQNALSLTQLLALVEQVLRVLDTLEHTAVSATFSVDAPLNNQEPVFELETSLTIQRNKAIVNSDFKGVTGIYRSTTSIPPMQSLAATGASGAGSLVGFTQKMEASYRNEQRLVKVATGEPNQDDRDTLWLVKWDAADGFSIKIDPSQPTYFAPKPLATQLVNLENVSVRPFTNGTLGKTKQQSFASVNLDQWGRQCLEAIDELLSPRFGIAAAYAGNSNESYAKILEAKASIAKAISERIAPILKGSNPASISLAQERLQQALQTRLSNAYDIEAIIQHSVQVKGPTGIFGTPPRLFGKPLPREQSTAGHTGANYAFSTAKVSMGGTSTAALTYLFNYRNAENQSFVDLSLEYGISHIEHQIREVPGITGFEASSWLSFIDPLQTSDLTSLGMNTLLGPSGMMQIPILLRSYPTPPSLLSQSFGAMGSTGTIGSTAAFQKSLEWDYRYLYRDISAKQDQVLTNVMYNSTGATGAGYTVNDGSALAQSLAQFVTAYPGIRKNFNEYLTKVVPYGSTGQNLQSAQIALQEFADLVSTVADDWAKYPEIIQSKVTPTGTYQLRENAVGPGQRLQISAFAPDATSWPLINIPDSPYKTVGSTGSEGEIRYTYETKGETFLSYEGRLAYPDREVDNRKLNIITNQNAWGGVGVMRNQHLIPGQTTNQDFIYRTPFVRPANLMNPLLVSDAEIRLSDIWPKNSPKELVYYFNELIQFILHYTPPKNRELTLKLQCDYRYTLNPSHEEYIGLPINLTIPCKFDLAEAANDHCTSLLTDLTTEITNWVTDHNLQSNTDPNQPDGSYHFNGLIHIALEVFSNFENKQPILKLENLFIDIETIQWTPQIK